MRKKKTKENADVDMIHCREGRTKGSAFGRIVLSLLICYACSSLYACYEPIATDTPNSERAPNGFSDEERVQNEEKIAADRAKVKELEETALLLASYGGAGLDVDGENVGFSEGYAVMAEGDVYYISLAFYLDSDKDTSEVSIIGTLNSEEVERVRNFIEVNRLLVDEFEYKQITDASWHLYVNSEGRHVAITNHVDLTDAAIAEIEDMLGIEK